MSGDRGTVDRASDSEQRYLHLLTAWASGPLHAFTAIAGLLSGAVGWFHCHRHIWHLLSAVQRSPSFVAGFMGDSVSTDWAWGKASGWLKRGPFTPHLFLLLSYWLHLRATGIRSWKSGTSELLPWAVQSQTGKNSPTETATRSPRRNTVLSQIRCS